MFKLAKVVDDDTKECMVAAGTNDSYYLSRGFEIMDVERGAMGTWYLAGYAQKNPEPDYRERRKEAYPAIEDQLDMLYWDKINGTTVWKDTISNIKEKYPKK